MNGTYAVIDIAGDQTAAAPDLGDDVTSSSGLRPVGP